jgi:hypothetical protein
MRPEDSAQPLRVALIEDDHSLRKMLSDTLEDAGGIEICGRFADAESAVERLPELNPDVALVDICLPGIDGVECVRRLNAAHFRRAGSRSNRLLAQASFAGGPGGGCSRDSPGRLAHQQQYRPESGGIISAQCESGGSYPAGAPGTGDPGIPGARL